PILNFFGANDSRNLYEQWRDERAHVMNAHTSGLAESAKPGSDKVISLPNATLALRKEEFYSGRRASIDIQVPSSRGALSFVINQPFQNTSATGYFEWHVVIDGKTHLKCDGAITKTP